MAIDKMNVHSEIALLDDGFVLRGSSGEVAVSFSDVCMIRAEKTDLFSYDEIRVTLERKNGPPVEISEESLGYNQLMGAYFRDSQEATLYGFPK